MKIRTILNWTWASIVLLVCVRCIHGIFWFFYNYLVTNMDQDITMYVIVWLTLGTFFMLFFFYYLIRLVWEFRGLVKEEQTYIRIYQVLILIMVIWILYDCWSNVDLEWKEHRFLVFNQVMVSFFSLFYLNVARKLKSPKNDNEERANDFLKRWEEYNASEKQDKEIRSKTNR